MLLEMAAAGVLLAKTGALASQSAALDQVIFPGALLLDEAQQVQVVVTVQPAAGMVEVYSQAGTGQHRQHLACHVSRLTETAEGAAPATARRNADLHVLADILAALAEPASPHGEVNMAVGAASGAAENGFFMQPCVLEGALQLPTGLHGGDEGMIWVPASMQTCLLQVPGQFAGFGDDGFNGVTTAFEQHKTSSSNRSKVVQGSVRLTDASGRSWLSLNDITFSGLEAGSAALMAAVPTAARATAALGGASSTNAGVPAPSMELVQVEQLVKSTVEAVLGQDVGPQEPLMAAGLDSLAATEVQRTLQQSVGLELPATLVFDYPTTAAISSFIAAQLGSQSAAAADGAATAIQRRQQFRVGRREHQPVVLVQGASSAPATLQDYAAGGDGIQLVPAGRWDLGRTTAVTGEELLPRLGAFLPGVEMFDYQAFGISPREAVGMDPQQRLLLQATVEALAGSSYNSSYTSSLAAAGLVVGAYVGIGSSDYELLGHHHGQQVGPFSFTSASASVASGRLAYVLGFKGPTASIDTACSASLVAVHLAAAALTSGAADAAVAAGVLLCLVPQSTLMVQRAGMLAADGRCKVLDASADGYVRGEACRAMYLTASVAGGEVQEGGPMPLGVVSGSAVNTNGRASSLTAPHGPTQQDLIAAAVADAGMTAEDVTGLQLHANGTALGDPIEVGAIAAAYKLKGSRGDGDRVFFLHTVKGYTGHQEAAAGAANALEAMQVLSQRALAPVLHMRNINPYVVQPLEGRRAFFNSSAALAPLPMTSSEAGISMGVSSFGAQGTNAHAIITSGKGPGQAAAAAMREKLVDLQPSCCWLVPDFQQLITSASVTRGRRGAAPKVAFEARLDAPGLAWLWEYMSTPLTPDQPAQPFLSNSVLVSMAASAAAMLMSSEPGANAAAGSQTLMLQHVVVAAPQPLPMKPGQPRQHMPVLMVAMVGPGSMVIEMGGQRQLHCHVAAEGSSDTAVLAASGGQVAASTAAVVALNQALPDLHSDILPLALSKNSQQLQQPPAQAMSVTALATDEVDDSGFVLHPAVLESLLQSAMLIPTQGPAEQDSTAQALWLSAIQGLVVPASKGLSPQAGSARGGVQAAVMASYTQALDGSSCRIDKLSLLGEGGGPLELHLVGGMLVADAMTAAEAGAFGEAGAAPLAAAGTAMAARAVTGAGDQSAAAENPLLGMDEEERSLYLQAQILGEVRAMVGHAVHPDEPLIAAGVDSRAGMELRQSLGRSLEALGINLPVTLLYDYQTVNQLVGYIAGEIEAAGGRLVGVQQEGGGVEEWEQGTGGRPAAAAAEDKPSDLLKLLRAAPPSRPLFLAAPGVANAQSAYFAFAQFLSWSDQPIYVLEKDNDMDIAQLARANAQDILKVQPEGPYLLGGHSYGGAVAMEIAMVLEEWGHEVGLVLVSGGEDTALHVKEQESKPTVWEVG
jgi:3-oxoacyl-(acyl-carrier-protein) synthase/acyl carrier protein